MRKLKVLYVDDEPISLKNFEETFKGEYEVFTATSGKQGLLILEDEMDVALILTDQRMPDMTGVEFLARVVNKFPDTVRMIITAYTDVDAILESINRGHVYRYILKPWDTKELVNTLMRAGEIYLSRKSDERLLEEFRQKKLTLEQLNAELNERIEVLARTIEELSASEEYHRLVVANASDAIITTNSGGRIISWNQSAEAMFGYSAEEAIDKPFSILFPKGAKRSYSHTIKDSVQKEPAEEGKCVQLLCERKDGSEIPVDISRSTWRIKEAVYNTSIMRDASARKKAEEAARKKELEIETHSRNLLEVNAALNMLLARKDEEKRDAEERVVSGLQRLALPYLEKMQETQLTNTQMTYVTILETNIRGLISPSSGNVGSRYLDLTPKEIQVANLIKEGRSNKAISNIMRVSINTILFHRHNLRKKLGLLNEKKNLRSYLSTIPT